MEKIPLNPMNNAEHFAIAALVNARDDRVWFRDGRKPDGTLEVTLIVEGHEVPFRKTINEIYERIHAEVNQIAAKMAYESATLKGLDKIQDAISQFDWQIRTKIEEIFGVTLEER